MAGVTDLPFREVCLQHGAGLATAEMVTADSTLWKSRKSHQRLQFGEHSGIRSVQLVGNDPAQMAEAARINADLGAEIIDINMGCPAKKVCKKAAGSALLRDEKLVADILSAVVTAVDIPVTLKIRTGWSPEHRNGLTIARLAERCGIQALAVHGRTRACRFNGTAEYQTIAEIVQAVSIPVVANGDIDTPQKAQYVLQQTGAAGVMVGRAACGNPWLFRQINAVLNGDKPEPLPGIWQRLTTAHNHIYTIHRFYGEYSGVRIARKHIGWYLEHLPEYQADRSAINRIESSEQQLQYLDMLGDSYRQQQNQAA